MAFLFIYSFDAKTLNFIRECPEMFYRQIQMKNNDKKYIVIILKIQVAPRKSNPDPIKNEIWLMLDLKKPNNHDDALVSL